MSTAMSRPASGGRIIVNNITFFIVYFGDFDCNNSRALIISNNSYIIYWFKMFNYYVIDNDQIKYQTALSKAELLLSNSKLKLLEFSLSMHVYSPRIEMYAQMAADRGVQCTTSVDIDGELVCSVEKLKSTLEQIIVGF